MSTLYIYNQNQLRVMFNSLIYNGIYTNEKVIKKMAKLINEDINVFIKNFAHDFSQKNFAYNKFEILNISNSDKRKLDYNKLYRYEYRHKSNMRTLFVVINDNKDIIILDAFNENGNKSNGKDSYDKAIKNAISNYVEIKEDLYE